MTDEALQSFWRERIEGLQRLQAKVADYKECEQCRAVSHTSVGICSVCHGYRFKESREELELTLFEMSCHALPLTQPVVPRTSEPMELTNHVAWGGARFGEHFGDNHE